MITPRSIESGNLLFWKAFSPAYLNAAVKIFIAIENWEKIFASAGNK